MPNQDWMYLASLYKGKAPGKMNGSLNVRDIDQLINGLQHAKATGKSVVFSVSKPQPGSKSAEKGAVANLSMGVVAPRDQQGSQSQRQQTSWGNNPIQQPGAVQPQSAPTPPPPARPENDDDIEW